MWRIFFPLYAATSMETWFEPENGQRKQGAGRRKFVRAADEAGREHSSPFRYLKRKDPYRRTASPIPPARIRMDVGIFSSLLPKRIVRARHLKAGGGARHAEETGRERGGCLIPVPVDLHLHVRRGKRHGGANSHRAGERLDACMALRGRRRGFGRLHQRRVHLREQA